MSRLFSADARASRNRGGRRMVGTLWMLALLVGAAGCNSKHTTLPEPPEASHAASANHSNQGAVASAAPPNLAPLREFESTRRAATDFARLPTSDRTMGADPFSIRALSGHPTLAGLLRGRDAIVVLDKALRELQRLPAPASPTGIAVTPEGFVFVSGEASSTLARYRMERDGTLRQTGSLALAGLRSIRDIAAGPEHVLYVVEDHDDRLVVLSLDPASKGDPVPQRRMEMHVGGGPMQILRTAKHLVINCLLSHTLVVLPVDAGGLPLSGSAVRIQHDGPFWGFDAIESPEGLLVTAGGIEDHPLDRSGGSFGYIDSFVFLYRVAETAVRLHAVNVSGQEVVTPKALRISLATGGEVTTIVTGYGGRQLAYLVFPADLTGPPSITARPFPPGTTSMAPLPGGGLAFANPLLDAFVSLRDDTVVMTSVPDAAAPARTQATRLGEALFFTVLMAPWNQNEGPLSRFTCEACHFEGYVDGRTHHTGRRDVRATTKPLLGLFNNRPHFSRALDPDLTAMVHNEFRVAGAKSGKDPWFSLDPTEAPWLAALGFGPNPIPPDELRRSLMTFLMEFTHRPNPSSQGRTSWTDVERDGARVFRDRCEHCHAARLISDDPASHVPFERWESLVMTREGPIVWGMNEYRKTGVMPYVHEKGARVPSLRRLYKKRPYFTNGSASDLRAVLSRARTSGGGDFYHDGAPEQADLLAVGKEEQEALLSFLDLL